MKSYWDAGVIAAFAVVGCGEGPPRTMGGPARVAAPPVAAAADSPKFESDDTQSGATGKKTSAIAPPPETLAATGDTQETKPDDTAAAAAETEATRAPPEALASMIKMYRSDNTLLLPVAEQTLRKWAPQSVPPLIELALDKQASLPSRLRATRLLAVVRSPAAATARQLEPLLEEGEPTLAQRAAITLGMLGYVTDRSWPLLVAAAGSDDFQYCYCRAGGTARKTGSAGRPGCCGSRPETNRAGDSPDAAEAT